MKQSRLSYEAQITRSCKGQARALLDTGNNRLWLIMSVVIWIASAGAVYLLCGSIVYAADASIFTDQPSALAIGLSLGSYGLMLLLFLLLLLPLGVGVLHVAELIYQKKTVVGSDLFAAFSSFRQYFLFLKVGVYALLPTLISIPVALIATLASAGLLQEQPEADSATIVLQALIVLFLWLVAAVLAIIALCLCRGRALTCVYMMRGMPMGKARARMKELRKGTGFGLVYYHLSFWGWGALAVLTVGASAVVDTIPYMLLCHQNACDSLITQEETNEELINKP